MPLLSSNTKSQRLLELLEAEIAAGRFGAGEAIPSQTDMAKEYGVSVTTVREALSALSQQGLIEKIQGKGAFLTEKALYGEKPVKNGIFAVVFQQIAYEMMSTTSPRSMPFYGPVFQGLEAMTRKIGVDICLCPTQSDELPRLIRERKVDGAIIIGHAPAIIKQIKEVGVPVIAFGAFSDLTHSVMADDRDGARQATKYLWDLGHRRIAFLGAEDLEKRPGKLRLQGYLEAMRELGATVRDEWVEQDLWIPHTTPLLPCLGCGRCTACIGWDTMKSKNGITSRTSELPFTGLVCHNDATAMGVIAQAKADGFEVPRDFSVIGFDDLSRAYHFSPEITSVNLSLRRMGEDAVQLLNDVFDKKYSGDNSQEEEYIQVITPVGLAIHSSVQAPPDAASIARRTNEVRLKSDTAALQTSST